MKDSCIIDWELYQKVMAKKNKNTITICTGVGSNMFFPEYVTIEIEKSIYKLWEETGLLEENPNKVNIAKLMESKATQLLRDELDKETIKKSKKNDNKKNTIITDWLEEHGDPEIEKEVIEHLEKIDTEIKKRGRKPKTDK
jgi:hypothetical protein